MKISHILERFFSKPPKKLEWVVDDWLGGGSILHFNTTHDTSKKTVWRVKARSKRTKEVFKLIVTKRGFLYEVAMENETEAHADWRL